jgi:predicted permease
MCIYIIQESIGSIIGSLLPDLDIEQARRSCSTLVLYVFLPALAFDAVYRAPLGGISGRFLS